ncbi:MAG: hypothetical protein ACD_87C00145G0003 [uncultured bacterium]|nr:MAG: hypothetical protein ACD_87C00145G0003 [uncultured bacterium]
MFIPGWLTTWILGSFLASSMSAGLGNSHMWMLPALSSRKRTEFSGMTRKISRFR